MRWSIILLAAGMVFGTLSMAQAAPERNVRNCGQCGFIQDSDQRSFCRAKCQGNAGQCGFIQDNDKRSYCRAVVQGNSGQCGFIRDNDLRNQCRAETY